MIRVRIAGTKKIALASPMALVELEGITKVKKAAKGLWVRQLDEIPLTDRETIAFLERVLAGDSSTEDEFDTELSLEIEEVVYIAVSMPAGDKKSIPITRSQEAELRTFPLLKEELHAVENSDHTWTFRISGQDHSFPSTVNDILVKICEIGDAPRFVGGSSSIETELSKMRMTPFELITSKDVHLRFSIITTMRDTDAYVENFLQKCTGS